MRKLLFLLFILVSNYNYAQIKKNLSDQDRLNDCISKNTHCFTFNGDQPTGKGWDILESLFAGNQFVAWGEYHNSPNLSLLAAHAMVSAANQGYNAFCVETSPFVAAELKHLSRLADPADSLEKIFKNGYPGIGVFPFFHTKEDARILKVANQYQYEIWGVDQEFQLSFSYCITRAYHSLRRATKEKYSALYDSLQAKWWYPDSYLLDSLKMVLRKGRFKRLIEEIKLRKKSIVITIMKEGQF